MAEMLLLVALLTSAAAQPAPADVSRAKAAESEAFVAIDEERWCEATQLFLEANGAAPSLDLVYNAAQAADLAEDRAQALKLYRDLESAYEKGERKVQVTERVRELTALIEKEGAGSACPAPAASAASNDPAEPVPALQPPPPATASNDGPPLPVLPWSVVGAGGVLVAGGAALSVLGSLPFLGFLDARDKILAAEAIGADASALQQQQADARAGWESWGELTAWSGVVVVITGALVSSAGLVWALSSGTASEEAEVPEPEVPEPDVPEPEPAEPAEEPTS